MSHQNTDQDYTQTQVMLNIEEEEAKANIIGQTRNIQQKQQSQINLNENSNNQVEVYKSYFMDIHIDAMFHEVDLKKLQKQVLYPNLQNIQIHINSCSLRQINFSYLRDGFNNFKKLKKLLIFLHHDGNMNFNSYKEIRGLLQQVPTLTELSICIEPNNIFNLKSLNALCEGIKCMSQLTHLKFVIKRQQFYPMNKQSIQHIGGFLKQLTQIIDLTLYLSCQSSDNCNFNQEISKSIQYLQELQKLILVIEYDYPNKQATPQGVISIFKALNNLKNLKHFSFSMKEISVNPAILEEAFKSLPSLESFTFFTKFSKSSNLIWKNQAQQCLKKIFPCIFNYSPQTAQSKYIDIFNNLSHIQNLSFSVHDLHEEGLISLGQGFKNFVSLKTLSILINPESQESNVKILPQTQTDLFEFHEDYVNSNNIQADEGIGSLAEGFSYLTQLQDLKLKIDHLKIQDKGAEYLKNSFKHFKNLNSLTLKIGNNYSGKGCFFKILMEGIQNLDSLQILELEIQQFIFSTENTQGLSDCFKNLKNLNNLNLCFTRSYYIMSTDNQISCLGDIFQNLSELTVLKLTVSYPGSSSIISFQLLQYIKKIKSLHLEISDPEINRQNLQKLSQSLLNCQQLQFIYFKLQSNKDDMQIFDKYFIKLLIKKIKNMKKLVKYSYKN